MAFKFRFEQILQICIHEENEVKNRLAKKEGQIAEITQGIKQFKQEHQQALENQIKDMQSGQMLKVHMYPAYLARLQKNWEFQEEELERLQKQREKIFQELLEKSQNRKTYEKMKEKDKIAWTKEQQKKEQRELDEFGTRLKHFKEDDKNA
jgi:flagellar FliJ protein